MERPSPSKKGERKPSSKLSLQKKTRTTKTDRNKVPSVPSSFSLVDLNETSEFKGGKSLSVSRGGSGDVGSGSGRNVGKLDK